MSDGQHSADAAIAPVPRVTLQAFCETAEIATVLQASAGDRRMQKAHVKVQMGGAPAALEAYRTAQTDFSRLDKLIDALIDLDEPEGLVIKGKEILSNGARSKSPRAPYRSSPSATQGKSSGSAAEHVGPVTP